MQLDHFLPYSLPAHSLGNYEGRGRVCEHGLALEALLANKTQGWDMVNEGSEIKQKWGYVASKPGETLSLTLNTTRQEQQHIPVMAVQVAYLKSYARMGSATIACTSGCTCDRLNVEALHSSKTSTIFLAQLSPTQHERCTISITVNNDTKSGEHKVSGAWLTSVHCQHGMRVPCLL